MDIRKSIPTTNLVMFFPIRILITTTECTYDSFGNVLTAKGEGGWCEYSYDKFGNTLTYKDFYGNFEEYTP